MQNPVLWFAAYNENYQGPEGSFEDPATLPWTSIIEREFELISRELSVLYQEDESLTPYFQDDLQFPPKSWKTLGFYTWGLKKHKTCQKFPITSSLLEKIPNLVGAFVSKMDAGSVIRPHSGSTNANLRCHLGLQVPKADQDECAIRVGNEVRSWQEGRFLVFTDAVCHNAWNNSPADRYVLIIDVIRDEFAHKKNFICSRIICTLAIAILSSRLKFLLNTPKSVLNFIGWLALPLTILLIYTQKRIRLFD